MPSCPAFLVAAPASGQGKTTVVAALARLHTRLGRRVSVFKCGPDFLDPQIHAVASGRPCQNVDAWMCGDADIAWRLAEAARVSDLILIEGVMGLFDGSPPAAELATRLGVPILAVIDAFGMSAGFGAVAYGLKHYRPGTPVVAALANRLGSPRHAELVEKSLPPDVAWYGYLPRDIDGAMPERHLGLLPAAEIDRLSDRIDRMAAHLAKTDAAKLPPPVRFADAPPPEFPRLLEGKTIAVARDAAFCFLYPANVDCLARLGASLIHFSPLSDAGVPPCDALWLPGGYPELHAPALASNRNFQREVRRHADAGKPLLAECGGMMPLFDSMTLADGQEFAMAGVLPGKIVMGKKLFGLGMQEAHLPEGALRGHAFHYSRCETPLLPLTVSERPDGRPGEAIYRRERTTASYMHLYFPSNPETAARLFLRDSNQGSGIRKQASGNRKQIS
ncbi:MAG: cobyrinate a,c-diamide synthase [Candidatus Accumulibacter sp.]|jgi:cobyrinic acid a,c-diamide synthase|nr:cobyrinate a,c-diamide synthase [Accumulibacter sp.]